MNSFEAPRGAKAAAEGDCILVTGGRGFIGKHLVEHLQGLGRQVISVDVTPATGPAADRVEEIGCDIRDPEAFAALLDSRRVSAVLDLASFTEVDLPASAYQRNVDATDSVTAALARRPGIKYIFYSTQFVHRVAGQPPGDEHEYSPVEAYGASKIRSERLIHERLPADQFLILRPTYIWGPGLLRFRDGLLKNLRKRRMLIPDDPALRRAYGYVKTVAAQTAEFAELDFARLPHKVYYLTDEPIALSDFCAHLVAALGEGGFHKAPAWFIRLLGRAGGIAAKLGLPAPINPTQARELVTNFPVPWERTAKLTRARTDYPRAARETVAWANETR